MHFLIPPLQSILERFADWGMSLFDTQVQDVPSPLPLFEGDEEKEEEQDKDGGSIQGREGDSDEYSRSSSSQGSRPIHRRGRHRRRKRHRRDSTGSDESSGGSVGRPDFGKLRL